MSSQALKDAINVAEAFLKEYDNNDRSHVCWDLLRSLIDATVSDPCLAADKAEECKYEYQQLSEKIAFHSNKKQKTFDNNRIGKEFNNLSERLTELQPLLSNIAKSLHLDVIPSIAKASNGGRGKKAELSLIAMPITSIDTVNITPTKSSPTETHGDIKVQYFLEATPKLPFWAQWCSIINLDRTKIRTWLMAFFIASPFFSIAFLFLFILFIGFGLQVSSTISTPLIILCINYPIVYLTFFKHLILTINNNIALMPNWMLPMRLQSAVLEVELYKGSVRPQRAKKMAVKVYAAKCPICQHRIDLKSGGIRNWGRIIGRCDGNPVEHRYSFDHTILLGKKLT